MEASSTNINALTAAQSPPNPETVLRSSVRACEMLVEEIKPLLGPNSKEKVFDDEGIIVVTNDGATALEYMARANVVVIWLMRE